GLIEHFQKIRTPLLDRVVHRGRGAECADTAATRLVDAEQAHHVAAVGVEAQGAIGEGARIGGEEAALTGLQGAVAFGDATPLVANFAHQLATIVLEERGAQVLPQAEPEALQVFRSIAPYRDGTQPGHPAALFQLFADLRDARLPAFEGEALAGDFLPRDTAGSHLDDGGVERLQFRLAQLEDPAPAAGHFLAMPHAGTDDLASLLHLPPSASLRLPSVSAMVPRPGQLGKCCLKSATCSAVRKRVRSPRSRRKSLA